MPDSAEPLVPDSPAADASENGSATARAITASLVGNVATLVRESRATALFVYLDALGGETLDLPHDVAEKVFYVAKTSEEQSVQVKESQPVKIGEIDSWRMLLKTGGRGGSVSATVTSAGSPPPWRTSSATLSRSSPDAH